MPAVEVNGHQPVGDEARCPLCQKIGKPVPQITVKSLARDHCGHGIPDGHYRLCLSSDCPVVYFGPVVFSKNDIKVGVWFKEEKGPRTICYCRNVTDADIVRHVALWKCCRTLEDIQAHTGANTGRECLTKNPGGT